MESQLRQAQKMESLGRLAVGIAHDFNNMMSIVIGYSDLIAEKLSATDSSLPRILKIKDAARRATALTRQLLAFSRLEAVNLKVMNLSAHTAQFAKMLPRLLGEDIQLTLSLEQDLWTVKADPSQLDQVLMNLAVNARDAMSYGGRLHIETRNIELTDANTATHPGVKPGPFAMICVSDTGVGISPEITPRIFEPFFTTKQTGNGPGLGLSTVYGIVKRSGGFIGVHSQVGIGTTFKIYLPRNEGPIESDPPIQPAEFACALPRRTILLTEDEPALRELTGQLLRGFGYTVLEADNGVEAIRIAEEYTEPIDLLFTDVVMPGMNGRELADGCIPKYPRSCLLRLYRSSSLW